MIRGADAITTQHQQIAISGVLPDLHEAYLSGEPGGGDDTVQRVFACITQEGMAKHEVRDAPGPAALPETPEVATHVQDAAIAQVADEIAVSELNHRRQRGLQGMRLVAVAHGVGSVTMGEGADNSVP